MVSEHVIDSSADSARHPRRPAVVRRVLFILMVICAIGFIVSIVVQPGDSVSWYLGPGVGTMASAALLGGLRGVTGGPLMRPWLVLGIGYGLAALGGVIYYLTTSLDQAATAHLADVVWLMFYPVVFVGVVLLVRRRVPAGRGFLWLDSLVVGAGSFAVLMAVADNQITTHLIDGVDSVVVTSLYVVGDFVLIALAAMVIQAFAGRPPGAWWVLIAGFVIFAVADSALFLQDVYGGYLGESWIAVAWPVSAALFGCAACMDRAATPVAPARHRWSLVAPSIAIIASGVVLAFRVGGPIAWVSTAAALLTIVLAVLRLNLDARQRLLLADRLRGSQADSLTGLLNRQGILDVSIEAGDQCALILLDLDAFKDVNNTMGHEVGDRVLSTVAERLKDNIRSTDALARLGDDEFAILVWEADAEMASQIAEEVILDLEHPLVLDGVPLLVTACAGVASTSNGSADVRDLLRDAEVALYSAKSEGPALVRSHDGNIGERSAERLRLRAEVRHDLSVNDKRFALHYQPIVTIADGSVLAVEGLMRWHHDGRLLTPGDFLPEVVRGGQMADLTRLALRRGLHEIKGMPIDVPVSINVPPELMTDWILRESWAALQAEHVDPSRLVVEITEEAIMKDPAGVARVLVALRKTGVRTLLDDFGTGWSGLSSLRDLVVDGLKIDGSFVSRVTTDPTADAIVRGVIQLAGELGVLVVCEGVEDADVITTLRAVGSGFIQGFAAARPMPAADLSRWIVLHGAGLHAWPVLVRPTNVG